MVRQSLPNLPATFLRALGLSIFSAALFAILPTKVVSHGQHENKKVAVSRDRRLSALRCWIHFLPTGLSVALAYLNIHGYYIGGELAGASGQDSAKLGALQLAAKMHELLINASIAAMVMSHVRYELTIGSGIPFGALVAGQRFTELSYLQ